MSQIVIGLIIGLAVGLVFWFVWRQKEAQKEEVEDNKRESFLMIQQQMEKLENRLDKQFNQSSQIVEKITTKLTKLDQTNKQVMNFAEQLESLEKVLKNPKQRGVLGEYYLETVLKNVLPPQHYEMQYKFENGQIVDAVVFFGDQILPIDSKFSLENYNRLIQESDPRHHQELEKKFKRDLKERIKETAKYIRPQEGTTDFAFMFIPSEGIFYDLLVNKVGTIKANTRDLIEYAFQKKRVIIVSPTSFFAYLQTVLQGLRALKIEESAKEIRHQVNSLSRHLTSYENYLKKMGNHLGTTVSMYNQAYHEFAKIDKDVAKITEGESKVERSKIDKPEP